MTTDPIKYGGFWRRFAALWLDFLVLLPLTALVFWGSQRYRLFSLYYFVPVDSLGCSTAYIWSAALAALPESSWAFASVRSPKNPLAIARRS